MKKINQVVLTDDGERGGKCCIDNLLGIFKSRRNGISGFKKFHREGKIVRIRFLRVKVSKQMKLQ